uniref:Uncharacterized protein n=1 Tax=Chromera velia CCMP2878 TaxID=1169474 RepID=A0A0G4HTQ6_9ALVE|eukprot:Cvel_31567.t1-p1 / transcript=Cvel_31567.t1 / gene=Cvel_31567 / organism=Chromera_velia_CCMP2878 / gene_product=hypothetical protein / transcript_product=hypothetical protein / location=Cvel_scaffold4728:2191-5812(+) / protein_length=902 / sequence_SO=supercontig / SO=protein_coding / is_pseudo=false
MSEANKESGEPLTPDSDQGQTQGTEASAAKTEGGKGKRRGLTGAQKLRAFVRSCALGETEAIDEAVINGISPTDPVIFSSEPAARRFVSEIWKELLGSREKGKEKGKSEGKRESKPESPNVFFLQCPRILQKETEVQSTPKKKTTQRLVFPHLSGLLAACLCGNVSTVSRLLQTHNADVKAKVNGKTVLHYVCEKEKGKGDADLQILRLLLQAGVDASEQTPNGLPPSRTRNAFAEDRPHERAIENHPSHKCAKSHSASVSLVRWALDTLPYIGRSGNTAGKALWEVWQRRRRPCGPDVLNSFLSCSPREGAVEEAVREEDTRGDGLLHAVVRRWKKRLDSHGQTPLLALLRLPSIPGWALHQIPPWYLLMIKKWGDPSQADFTGKPPFVDAARRFASLPPIFQDPERLLSGDLEGKNVLHHAVCQKNSSLCEWLLNHKQEQAAALLLSRDAEGKSALLHAASLKPGSFSIVKKLVEEMEKRGMRWRDAKDNQGASLLYHAGLPRGMLSNQTEILAGGDPGMFLLLFGADAHPFAFSHQNRDSPMTLSQNTSTKGGEGEASAWLSAQLGNLGQSSELGLHFYSLLRTAFPTTFRQNEIKAALILTEFPPDKLHFGRVSVLLLSLLKAHEEHMQSHPDSLLCSGSPHFAKERWLREAVKALLQVVRFRLCRALRFHATVLLAVGGTLPRSSNWGDEVYKKALERLAAGRGGAVFSMQSALWRHDFDRVALLMDGGDEGIPSFSPFQPSEGARLQSNSGIHTRMRGEREAWKEPIRETRGAFAKWLGGSVSGAGPQGKAGGSAWPRRPLFVHSLLSSASRDPDPESQPTTRAASSSSSSSPCLLTGGPTPTPSRDTDEIEKTWHVPVMRECVLSALRIENKIDEETTFALVRLVGKAMKGASKA